MNKDKIFVVKNYVKRLLKGLKHMSEESMMVKIVEDYLEEQYKVKVEIVDVVYGEDKDHRFFIAYDLFQSPYTITDPDVVEKLIECKDNQSECLNTN